MLDSGLFPGITNLLASEAQFSDVIHADLYSDCHVIPVGTADPVRAMRAADRLPIIMQSLTTAYDLVVVECGPADAQGISRLVGEGTEVFLSMLEPDDEVTQAAVRLIESGYPDLTLVTPVGHETPGTPAGTALRRLKECGCLQQLRSSQVPGSSRRIPCSRPSVAAGPCTFAWW